MSEGVIRAAHDVLIVGGGGAGLRAAIAIAETNPRPRRGGGVEGLPDAQPHGVRRGGCGGRDRRRRHPRGALLRHDLGQRLARRPGRHRGVRPRGPPRAAPARALGVPLEPSAGRSHRGPGVRRHEEDADLVRGRQDRIPHAAHAVPDVAEVRRGHPLRRGLRHPAPGRRRPRARRRGGRPDDREDPGGHRQGGHPVPPGAAARSSRSPRTPTSTPATACPSPTGRARRSRTWSSSSTTRPACRSPAS